MNDTISAPRTGAPPPETWPPPAVDIPAYGGKMEVRWDPDAKATPSGGLAHFAFFLKLSGLFDSLCGDFPVEYASNNSCSKRDIVGTVVLSVLRGHSRYAHVNALRNDAAAAEMLGLGKVVTDDSVRRALARAGEAELDAWLSRHEHEAVDSMLRRDYVIDIDSTVKPIFGHQEGAELGYSPVKPGRPSLNYHTFFIGMARIVLGVDVRGGSQHAGVHGVPRLWRFLDGLPRDSRPRLLRGDVGYGSDRIMSEAEARSVTYLFKIRRAGLAKSIFRHFADGGGWSPCGGGWEAREHHLRLESWRLARRCIFVRRPAERKPGAEARKRGGARKPSAPQQAEFDFAKDARGREWDYCVLVTNDAESDATALSQLYRDRGDCENNFDEFKNQWGWGGYTTRKLKPTRAMARLIGIVANWWNVYVRLADPDAHREPVTSRPAYLDIVGRIVMHGGRRVLHLTSTHACADAVKAALTRIGAFLGWVASTAAQSSREVRWTMIWTHAFRKLLVTKPPDGAILLPLRS